MKILGKDLVQNKDLNNNYSDDDYDDIMKKNQYYLTCKLRSNLLVPVLFGSIFNLILPDN